MTTKKSVPETPSSILITGASSGIGEALALHYAAPGIHLFLSGRDALRLDAVVAACAAKGATTTGRVVDVRDADAMENWISESDRIHPLDLVIANAGVSGGTGGGPESARQVRDIFDVNVGGVFNTVLPAAALMTARGSGQIAIMASLAGFSGWPGAPAYSASKGAVRLYGEALRGAVAAAGVRVNVICPGFVESRMTAVNPYPMPFLMDSARAARIIARGLSRNTGRIAFPWQSHFLALGISFLPFCLVFSILKNMPRKPATGDKTL